jgi:hypothetical protein
MIEEGGPVGALRGKGGPGGEGIYDLTTDE